MRRHVVDGDGARFMIFVRQSLVALALALGMPVARAQSRDDDRGSCQSNDPQASIRGCSVLIQSNQETTLYLSIDRSLQSGQCLYEN